VSERLKEHAWEVYGLIAHRGFEYRDADDGSEQAILEQRIVQHIAVPVQGLRVPRRLHVRIGAVVVVDGRPKPS
jgi:hypothetical protein